MIDLSSITKESIELVKEVGSFIKRESLNLTEESIQRKGKNNFVTYVDKEAERLLVEGFRTILPASGFLTEEDTKDTAGEYRWIIDPLDGTTNFIHNIPFCSVSVALMYQERIIFGIVYEVNRGECFYSSEGGKAYINGKEIRVSPVAALSEALLATGFPYQYFEKVEQYTRLLADLMRRSRGLRRLGSAALDLAYVACGRFDGFYEYNLNAWDVAAGAFLVQQAGGLVTDFSGGQNYIFGREIIAAPPLISRELVGVIQAHF